MTWIPKPQFDCNANLIEQEQKRINMQFISNFKTGNEAKRSFLRTPDFVELANIVQSDDEAIKD